MTSRCQTWCPWPPCRQVSPKLRPLSVCISLPAWWAPLTGEWRWLLRSSSQELIAAPYLTYLLFSFFFFCQRSNDDKYVFQLQKRMKKSQFNVCKQAPSSKVRIHKGCFDLETHGFILHTGKTIPVCVSFRTSHPRRQLNEQWEDVVTQVGFLRNVLVTSLHLCSVEGRDKITETP